MFAWVYVVSMAIISAGAVVRYFSCDGSALPEYKMIMNSAWKIQVPLIGAQDDSMDVDEGI